MWLEAVEGVQLVTETTTDFRNLDILLGGLSSFILNSCGALTF
jgi:hypothetical protein